MVEGVYGIKAKLPAIAGNEGVAVVREVCAFFLSFTMNKLTWLGWQPSEKRQSWRLGDPSWWWIWNMERRNCCE
jgi:hypothetical protein